MYMQKIGTLDFVPASGARALEQIKEVWLEVYILFYKKHIRPEIENVVSYMRDTTVPSSFPSVYSHNSKSFLKGKTLRESYGFPSTVFQRTVFL